MATINKRINKSGAVSYKAEVCVRGHRKSKSFPTKREAQAWATDYERTYKPISNNEATLADILRRYRDRITVQKRSKKWETNKINFLIRSFPELVNTPISELSRKDVSGWRDRRLQQVSPSSVTREWCVMNHAMTLAIRDWEAATSNPFREVKRPQATPPRERIITPEEIKAILLAASYSSDASPKLIIQRAAAAFLFATETAMRAQEICNLTWDDVQDRVVHVTTSKTRSGIRQVPLSTKATQIIEQMRPLEMDTVFGISKMQLASNFQRLKKMIGSPDFTFHDSRATAITHLAKKIDIMDLARMIGHANLSQLMVYYRQTAEQLADKLD